jgi:hypothetical protein
MSYHDPYFFPFNAHGKRYTSPEQANARIKEINEEIFRIGLSDGRLTEWLVIEEALAEEWASASERRQAAEHAQWKRDQIKNTEHELEMLKIDLNGEREYANCIGRRIDWIDKDGKRRISRYSTEGGFLRAYLKMVKDDIDIIFAE